ncbi:MAG: cytochrome c [Gemmatimonadetes bacterium]|nr:cytochrome c [Gemmatimonadota bacterium]
MSQRSGLPFWPRHAFWQGVALTIVAYVLFDWGIPALRFVGIPSAPVPNSVVVEFMFIALIGIFMYVSENEARWAEFKQPIQSALVNRDKKWLRSSLLVVLPLFVGFMTFESTRPRVTADIQPRSIHPAPPTSITFRNKTIQLAGLENPLRKQGNLEDHMKEGRRVYYQNCLPCHGDLLDGKGHFGLGFSPTPLAFDGGNLPLLTESFVFWRVAKGGPGLPKEGTPWNSAMPVWEDFLTEDEIWSVIIFLYDQAGFKPRAWEAEGKEAAHE